MKKIFTVDVIIKLFFSLVLAPLAMMYAWRAIAWEFNLPTFDFWIVLLIRVAYKMWFGKTKTQDDETK